MGLKQSMGHLCAVAFQAVEWDCHCHTLPITHTMLLERCVRSLRLENINGLETDWQIDAWVLCEQEGLHQKLLRVQASKAALDFVSLSQWNCSHLSIGSGAHVCRPILKLQVKDAYCSQALPYPNIGIALPAPWQYTTQWIPLQPSGCLHVNLGQSGHPSWSKNLDALCRSWRASFLPAGRLPCIKYWMVESIQDGSSPTCSTTSSLLMLGSSSTSKKTCAHTSTPTGPGK